MRGSGDGNGGGAPPAPRPRAPTVPSVRPGEIGWIPLPFYSCLDTDFKKRFRNKFMGAFRHCDAVHPRSKIILMEYAEAQIDWEIPQEFQAIWIELSWRLVSNAPRLC